MSSRVISCGYIMPLMPEESLVIASLSFNQVAWLLTNGKPLQSERRASRRALFIRVVALGDDWSVDSHAEHRINFKGRTSFRLALEQASFRT